MKKESDFELMARVAKGERAPLGELFLRYGRMVQSAVSRWLPDSSPADSEDLVQDIFVALGSNAHKYQDKGRFAAWLYVVAYRKAMDKGRSQSRHKKRIEMSKHMAVSSAGATQPLAHDKRSEMRRAIRQILNQLPDELREVLILKTVEGFSSSEIGKITGVAEATARTRFYRARQEVLSNVEAANWKELLEGGIL